MKELLGNEVVQALMKRLSEEIITLKEAGISPKLVVVRVGENGDDIAYERAILNRFSSVNALVEVITFPEDVSQENLESTVLNLNQRKNVHGILLFRPLPKHLSEDRIKSLISETKDVDGMSLLNLAHVFAGDKKGYPPCTAQAVIELFDYYDIDLTGKKIVIIGRSLVVGKPLAMLLLSKNATVTVCHTKTANLSEECKKADILIACAGAAKMVTADYVSSAQIVVDVGVNMVNGKLCGDVDYDGVIKKVKAITPVPGGVGTVTTAVLLKHTIESAKRSEWKNEFN